MGCFRRKFVLGKKAQLPPVRITADARYELYVNGEFVGHGPVRSWPAIWSVDEYDVNHLLHPGENVMAVLVIDWGISTFQYLDNEPGLLVEMGKIFSDGQWKCKAHDGYGYPTPRISCQQGWEEQFDARVAPGSPEQWTRIDFDDSRWPAATAGLRAVDGAHRHFERRDIPFLTCDPVHATRVMDVQAVRPADYNWTINPRELLNGHDRSANQIVGRMLVVTHIYSAVNQQIQLHPPHDLLVGWKLNGRELNFDDQTLQETDTGVAHARLKKGWNTLMGKLPEQAHRWWAMINLWTEKPVVFAGTMDREGPSIVRESSAMRGGSERLSPWLAIGPFDVQPRPQSFDTLFVQAEKIEPGATAKRFNEIWKNGLLTERELGEPFCRPVPPEMVCATNVYAICASERPCSMGVPPMTGASEMQHRRDAHATNNAIHLDDSSAMLHDNGDWTTVYPSGGGDVRFLLDFGREVIGFHEFEIDAPAGTIIDFHNFEFIQRDGRKNLAEGMNNSFRYVCRQGVQRYRSFVRRGFRYSWMTLRNFDKPVRIRLVRMRMSTYPFTGNGEFACSDDRLNEIWKTGVHSVRCCAEDTYTDCPTYEQTLWVGDARNEAMIDLIANGDPRLSRRCLRLTGRSLMRSPIAESQVPSGWQNILPAWTFLWMRWAQEHYQLTGDREAATEILELLEQNFNGIESNINDRGLFEMRAWNLFDWAPMDTPATGIVTHVSCLAVLGLRQSAELAEAMGQNRRAKSWRGLASRITAGVNKYLWSDDKQAYLDCIHADGSPSNIFSQQTQTAAYISGVASEGRAERCRQIIHRAPRGFVRAGSPFFMFFLLEALVKEQNFDQLIDTIRGYWGKQIEAGATTFWEMYHEDQPRLTRSHCHGWSAAPVVFLTQHLLGVQPAAPGYRRIKIAPHPAGVQWCQGRVPTPWGIVECLWKNSGKNFELTASVPPGTIGEIDLPSKGKLQIISGKARRTGQTNILSFQNNLALKLTRGTRLVNDSIRHRLM